MKRIFALFVCVIMAASFTACAGQSNGETSEDTGSKSSGTVQTEPETTETESDSEPLSSNGVVED